LENYGRFWAAVSVRLIPVCAMRCPAALLEEIDPIPEQMLCKRPSGLRTPGIRAPLIRDLPFIGPFVVLSIHSPFRRSGGIG
jgi:hypothetical protein